MNKVILLVLISISRLFSIEKSIVVIVPSYNNINYFKWNIDSILDQQYENFRVIYLDDHSNDGMGDLVKAYLQEKNVDFSNIIFESVLGESLLVTARRFALTARSEDAFFLLVQNETRSGALANIYRAAHSINDGDIIVLVDGDDSFYDSEVLKRVNIAYSSTNEVWLTHGNLIEFPSGNVTWCEPVPQEIIENNTFREFKCPSHLRTFYAWLFKKIDFSDLIYKGDFFQMTWDMAIMYPMIEMAGDRHEFLSEINYCYNMQNSINDNKVNPQLQNYLDRLIRTMPPYHPLKESEIRSFIGGG